MESIRSIFINIIKDNRSNPQLLKIIKDSSYELSLKKIQRIKDENAIQKRVLELFNLFHEVLEEEKLNTQEAIKSLLHGLIKATSFSHEETLYKTCIEKEILEKSIQIQKINIKKLISNTFYTIETSIQKSENKENLTILDAIEDVKLLNIEMLGILKETTEEAILVILEQAEDVEDNVYEVTKNITYHAINEGLLSKHRYIDICTTIMDVAIELGNEDLRFTKELINGAVKGTQEGLIKAIEKLKNTISLMPKDTDEFLEEDLENIKKDLNKTEEYFVSTLKQIAKKSTGPSSDVLKDITNDMNDSVIKLKRISQELKDLLGEKADSIKEEAIRLEKELSKKLKGFKKDASSKIESFNLSEATQNAKKAADEAKKLGLRAWNIAKNVADGAIKGAKEAIKKDDKTKE